MIIQEKDDNNIKDSHEEELKAKARSISIKEGSAFCVSEGFGMRYITPYALFLGADNTFIGLLNSIPQLTGNFSQLFTIRAMKKFSRKRIASIGALFQAIMWLVIFALGIIYFKADISSLTISYILVISYSFLIVGGAFYGPAWISWMRDITSGQRGNYFGRRSRIVGSVALVSMLAAGFILDIFELRNRLFIGFAILFSVSFLTRAVSSFLFTRKYEPHFRFEDKSHFTFIQFLKKMPTSNFGKYVFSFSMIHMATAIASPFFAVYMLKNLNFNYLNYTIITMAPVFSSLIFVQLWGKFSDSYGNLKTMKISNLYIPFIPLLWIFSIFVAKFGVFPLVAYLFIIESLSGMVWAGFNLSAGNFVYDAVTRERTALCFTYMSILQSIGVFIGATLGGVIASSSLELFGLTPLPIVFLISFILRLLLSLSFFNVREVREVKKFGINRFIKDNFLGIISSSESSYTKPRDVQ